MTLSRRAGMVAQSHLSAVMVFSVLVVAGCSASPTSAAGPTGDVSVDSGSHLVVDPIGPDGNGTVSASFGAPTEGRTVYLQARKAATWTTVATGAEDTSGQTHFAAPSGISDYRAVAAASESLPAVATETIPANAQYHTLLAENFDGTALDESHWSVRMPGVYSKVRRCSASSARMVTVADGEVSLSVDKSDPEQAAKAKAAAISLGANPANPCPYGTYDNGMISTDGKVNFTYGLVAARVKFPPQQGQHACAWLQSADGSGDEVDFAETFGLGKGIQYKLYHYTDGKLDGRGSYITSIPAVKDPAWWSAYHIVSLEWTSQAYRITVDGQEVLKATDHVASSDKYLILSLLTSDWELNRLKSSDLPTSMKVDWVRIMQK